MSEISCEISDFLFAISLILISKEGVDRDSLWRLWKQKVQNPWQARTRTLACARSARVSTWWIVYCLMGHLSFFLHSWFIRLHSCAIFWD